MKIVSINFWGIPWPFSKHKNIRMRRLLDYLTKENPDLICMQEVWLRHDLKKIKRLKGYELATSKTSFFNEGGLVTLSKFRIEESRFISFKTFEIGSNKGILIVKTNGFFVINTHLYSSFDPFFSKQFNKQINFIRSLVSNQKTILAGDFNIDFRRTKFDGYKMVSPIAYTRETDNIYSKRMFNGFVKDNQIFDHVYCNFKVDALRSEIVKKPIVSDHYIIKVEFK